MNFRISNDRKKIVVLCLTVFYAFISKGESFQKDESFKDFYQKFNQDKAFQKLRIKCEIGGYFKFDIPNLDKSIFEVKTSFERGKVTEIISYKNDTSYYVKYVFKLENRKWYLVSYVDSWGD